MRSEAIAECKLTMESPLSIPIEERVSQAFSLTWKPPFHPHRLGPIVYLNSFSQVSPMTTIPIDMNNNSINISTESSYLISVQKYCRLDISWWEEVHPMFTISPSYKQSIAQTNTGSANIHSASNCLQHRFKINNSFGIPFYSIFIHGQSREMNLTDGGSSEPMNPPSKRHSGFRGGSTPGRGKGNSVNPTSSVGCQKEATIPVRIRPTHCEFLSVLPLFT